MPSGNISDILPPVTYEQLGFILQCHVNASSRRYLLLSERLRSFHNLVAEGRITWDVACSHARIGFHARLPSEGHTVNVACFACGFDFVAGHLSNRPAYCPWPDCPMRAAVAYGAGDQTAMLAEFEPPPGQLRPSDADLTALADWLEGPAGRVVTALSSSADAALLCTAELLLVERLPIETIRADVVVDRLQVDLLVTDNAFRRYPVLNTDAPSAFADGFVRLVRLGPMSGVALLRPTTGPAEVHYQVAGAAPVQPVEIYNQYFPPPAMPNTPP